MEDQNLNFIPRKVCIIRKIYQGFTLLELLLVLLILGILTLGGINQYRRYQSQQSFLAIQHNVFLLMSIGSDFYHDQCENKRIPFEKKFKSEFFNIYKAKEIFPFQLVDSPLVNPASKREQGNFSLKGYEIGVELMDEPLYLPRGSNEKTAKIIGYSYRLQLKVSLIDRILPQEMEAYRSLLGAQRIEGNRLIWEQLPNAPKQKIKDASGIASWITETGLTQFKKKATENLTKNMRLNEQPILQCAN